MHHVCANKIKLLDIITKKTFIYYFEYAHIY